MNIGFFIFHLVISLGLIALVLLQSSKGGLNRGSGGGEFYRTRRGAEKLIFRLTFVFILLFLLSSVTHMLVR